eukprot:gene10007-2326_t
MNFSTHNSYGEKMSWIHNLVENHPDVSLEKTNCMGTIAYVQHHIVLHWISEYILDLFQRDVKLKNTDGAKVLDGIKATLECNLYEPIVGIFGLIQFGRLLKQTKKENITSEDCILWITNSILLSSKMHEDHILRAREFYEESKLEELEISFLTFLHHERNVFEILNYELNIKQEDIQNFINTNSKSVSSKVVDIVFEKCGFCFATRRKLTL